MKKIQFGNYNSYDDFNLILNSAEIGSPEPKTKTIEVEGGDGVLDLTELFGRISYKNRTLLFNFTVHNVLQSQFLTLFSDIQDKIQGKRMHITLDEDAEFYYIGRIATNGFSKDKNVGLINIECDCEPYKYKKEVTTISQDIVESATINLQNLKKRTVPTITIDSEMTIEYEIDGTTYSITHNAGTFTVPTLELREGDNLVTITGTGNVTFVYQEGGL